MGKLNTYLDIKQMREVIIGEDYPYTNLPELPLCEKLIIRNANIKTIESQPNCYDIDIISCLQGNKGQLHQIGDLPVCTFLSVYASKLKLIGQIPNCEELRLINMHNRKPIIDISTEIKILKDRDLNILHIASKGLSTREVIEEMLDRGLPLIDIDFTKSRLYEHRHPNYIDLKNVDFSGVPIGNVKFEWCNLRGANFEKSQLDRVVFEHCFFDLANFREVDFSSSTVKECRFERTDLKNAIITPNMVNWLDDCSTEGVSVDVQGEKIKLTEWQEKDGNIYSCDDIERASVVLHTVNGHVYFIGTDNMSFMDTMRKLLFEKQKIEGLDLSNVSCSDEVKLACLSFTNHTLSHLKISDCELQFVSFKGSVLDDVVFENCDFISTDFSDLDLVNVSFSECTFSDATLFHGSTISPQLAVLLADSEKLPANVMVKTSEAEPILLEQFLSSIPKNNFNTLWDTRNLYLIFENSPETDICFAGTEIDCYRLLATLSEEQIHFIKQCDTYLNEHRHTSDIRNICNQILLFKDHPYNEASHYNIVNYLDEILVDIMSEALKFSYLDELRQCQDFVNEYSFKDCPLYQSACFLGNNKIEINLRLHVTGEPLPPQQLKVGKQMPR